MENLVAIIVEDEIDKAAELRDTVLRCCPGIKIEAIATDLTQARLYITLYQPKLIFLDILLNDENGLDLLPAIDGRNVQIIFTTAHSNSEFMLMAIRRSAAAYLLKPIEPVDLMTACRKVKENINNNQLLQNYEALTLNVKSPYSLSIGNGLHLPFNDIIYLEACGSSTDLFLRKEVKGFGKHTVTKNIGTIEELMPDTFFRIHESHIVNLTFITGYDRSTKQVTLDGHIVLDIAKRRISDFNDAIKDLGGKLMPLL
jgi:two-component system LytT family response regulator